MTSNQIKRLTADAVDSLPLAADVGLAVKAKRRGHRHAAGHRSRF